MSLGKTIDGVWYESVYTARFFQKTFRCQVMVSNLEGPFIPRENLRVDMPASFVQKCTRFKLLDHDLTILFTDPIVRETIIPYRTVNCSINSIDRFRAKVFLIDN